MTDRDHFASAALTGLLAGRKFTALDDAIVAEAYAEAAYGIADAMLRERANHIPDAGKMVETPTNLDAAPVARAGTPGTGDTPEIAAYARFVGQVMNWISEATSAYAPACSSDGGRKIMADACSRCWDAFDRIAYPTVHGASPEARAESDEDRTDKAATSHRRDGNGDTPATRATHGEGSEPREGSVPVAWGVANGNGLLATSIHRIDAVDMQSEHECDTAVVPLYLHPPVTEPMPKEKRAEVSDRSKPITGPDPDSRVWETHAPATHATRGEGSEPREGAEPVAWAVMLADGERIYDVYATEEEAKAIDEAVTGNHGVVPLYRSPTLTDAEREAVEWYANFPDGIHAATLRGLLGRLGGGR